MLHLQAFFLEVTFKLLEQYCVVYL